MQPLRGIALKVSAVLVFTIMSALIKATADIGPRPGNIPMKVPAKQPTTTIIMLNGMIAVLRPTNIPSNMTLTSKQHGY